ncbi:MAG: hypothetical protein AAGJ79_05035 [Verrucomicrobiota bacterium]
MSIFSKIQDYQDDLVARFCHPKRRMEARTEWFAEDADHELLREDCLRRILFFEQRGFYLFQEPQIEHEPASRRMRAVLTFKPTESNQG